jgi:Sugar phosphate isomerases/epimerases
MQKLKTQALTRLNVGINSRMIKELYGGPISACTVDLIEVSIADSGVLQKDAVIDQTRLGEFATLSNAFSVHGPFIQDYYGNAVNWGLKSEHNFEIMDQVFKVADYLGAECVVLHGDQVQEDHHEAFLNVVDNFKRLAKMAADYSLIILLENVHRQKTIDRVGILPQEVLAVIQAVGAENLKFCFDIGHGTLTANEHHFDILEFVRVLSPYLYHMHVHDNMGIPEVVDERFGDQHMPLGFGKVEYQRIFQAVAGLGVKNMVLELRKRDGRAAAEKSINILRGVQGRRPQP